MNSLWKQTKRITAGLLILIIVLMALTYAAGAIAKRNLMEKYPAPGQLTNAGAFIALSVIPFLVYVHVDKKNRLF